MKIIWKKLQKKTPEPLLFGLWTHGQTKPIDTCLANDTGHARKIFESIHDKKFSYDSGYIIENYQPDLCWSDRPGGAVLSENSALSL